MVNIELGGGNDPKYHPNIDALALANVDIVHNLCQGIPLPDTHADLIYSCDFIEHLPFPAFINLLSECKRVLKDGGKIEFVTPDVKKCLFNHTWWNDNVHHVIVGNDECYRSGDWTSGKSYLRHQMWFTPELMGYVLVNEDWRNIEITDYKKDSDWWREPKMKVVATK